MMTKAEAVKWLESLKREIGKTENRPLWHYAESIDMVIEAMSETKTGKWMLSDLQSTGEMENGNYYYFCSNCLRGDVHAKTQEVPYCWFCGAKMNKGGDDE